MRTTLILTAALSLCACEEPEDVTQLVESTVGEVSIETFEVGCMDQPDGASTHHYKPVGATIQVDACDLDEDLNPISCETYSGPFSGEVNEHTGEMLLLIPCDHDRLTITQITRSE